MSERYEQFTNTQVAEGGGEVEVGVRESREGGVGVMEERWVGFEDSLDEEDIVGVDGAADAEGWVDPLICPGEGQYYSAWHKGETRDQLYEHCAGFCG